MCASRSHDHRAGPGVERVDHVADDVGLLGSLVVTRLHPPHHLVVGQALLLQLRDVVVAVQARRRLLERLAADGRGHVHAAVPDDRRRPSAARHVHRPLHLLGRRPPQRARSPRERPLPVGPRKPGHPVVVDADIGANAMGRARRTSRASARASPSSIDQPRRFAVTARRDWRYGLCDQRSSAPCGPSRPEARGYASALSRVPLPRVLSTVVLEAAVARRPPEHRARAGGIGHQFRRIAWPPRGRIEGHVPAADLTHCVDHLPHRVPHPGTQVDGLAGRAAVQALDRAQVRVGQVGDVDVVAHGGAVRRRVVGAEHLHGPTRAERAANHERDQVGLRIVVLRRSRRRDRRRRR